MAATVASFIVTYTRFKNSKNNKGVKDGTLSWNANKSEIVLYDEEGSEIERSTVGGSGGPEIDEHMLTDGHKIYVVEPTFVGDGQNLDPQCTRAPHQGLQHVGQRKRRKLMVTPARSKPSWVGADEQHVSSNHASERQPVRDPPCWREHVVAQEAITTCSDAKSKLHELSPFYDDKSPRAQEGFGRDRLVVLARDRTDDEIMKIFLGGPDVVTCVAFSADGLTNEVEVLSLVQESTRSTQSCAMSRGESLGADKPKTWPPQQTVRGELGAPSGEAENLTNAFGTVSTCNHSAAQKLPTSQPHASHHVGKDMKKQNLSEVQVGATLLGKLSWPVKAATSNHSPSIIRRRPIRTKYDQRQGYISDLAEACVEEIQVEVNKAAITLWDLAKLTTRKGGMSSAALNESAVGVEQGDFRKEFCVKLKKRGLLLKRASLRAVKPYWGNRRGSGGGGSSSGGGSSDDEFLADVINDGPMLFLRFEDKGPSSDHEKGDLWFFGSDPASFGVGGGSTRLCAPPESLCSTYFGVTKDHETRVAHLSAESGRRWSFREAQQGWAIKVGNVFHEARVLECLGSPRTLDKIMPSLLCPGKKAGVCDASGAVDGRHAIVSSEALVNPWHVPAEEVTAAVEQLVATHTLNDDQEMALRRCATWFHEDLAIVDAGRIVLIHGPFGTGKSTLLVAICVFLERMLRRVAETRGAARSTFARKSRSPSSPPGILVASGTNVAVDRVLCGLKDEGYDNFARVGSLRRIDRRILDHVVVHEQVDKELKMLLQHAAGSGKGGGGGKWHCDSATHEQLEELSAKWASDDQLAQMRRASAAATIVGTTCCSSQNAALDGRSFPIVVMDEASQMKEPTCLLPMCRHGCEFLVICGDPQQLPPVVSTQFVGEQKAGVGRLAAVETTARGTLARGLERSLFARIIDSGLEPVMLRTQYRCHPVISKVCNNMFYGGRLLDGVDASMRSAVCRGLPPLRFFGVEDGREERVGTRGGYSAGKSNHKEAKFVTDMVMELVSRRGLPGEDIGVICLYRAQASKIRSMLENWTAMGHSDNTAGNVIVSTVDAFQGAERKVIFVTTCVTEKSTSDHVANDERLNVAFSRAKNHLFIVGNTYGLSQYRRWRVFIKDIKSNLRYVSAEARPATSLLPPPVMPRTVCSDTDDNAGTRDGKGDKIAAMSTDSATAGSVPRSMCGDEEGDSKVARDQGSISQHDTGSSEGEDDLAVNPKRGVHKLSASLRLIDDEEDDDGIDLDCG